MKKRKNEVCDLPKVKGFLRLQLVNRKTKKVEGDSGWLQNQITNYGWESCIVAAPIGAGSVQASGILLGSSEAAIASDATNLGASLSDFWGGFDTSTVVASSTARMIVSFDGATKGPATLKEIGVKAASTATLLFGQTFASSALTTDQDVNCSYELRYS